MRPLILTAILGVLIVSSCVVSLADRNVEARTEQIADTSNKNLMISMEAPDSWNSGLISQTIADLDWRVNGVDAFSKDLNSVFAVANLPAIANKALPLLPLLSLILPQFVTVNGESDLKLSDGSTAHSFSISVTPEQFKKLKVPFDKGFDAVIIFTQQQGSAYAVVYATELGKMSQFESTFQNILSTIKFGSVSFSGSSPVVPQQAPPVQTPEPVPAPVVEPNPPMSGDNATSGGGGASIIIVPGASDKDNGKHLDPDVINVSTGTAVSWINNDSELHTVTSGSPNNVGTSGIEFDSSYIEAGKTFEHTFSKVGEFDYYCAIHPFMKGKVIVS